MIGNRVQKRFREYGRVQWGVCLYLLDGPLTLEEIKANYRKSPFPLSRQLTYYRKAGWNQRGLAQLPNDLAGLLQAGWVIQQDDKYGLTDHGRVELQKAMEEARISTHWVASKLGGLFQPEAASKVTLIVQIILAVIKLPAGLLSGSVGLLNDAADTILDLFSSLFVYLGIRFNKERLVSILLVVFMVGTGGFTLYEAIHRIFVPYVPKVDWFPFAAALLSALAGLLLWTYQRYIGIHSGLMAFIAESVDSRNHVIVALSVTAGLIAALLKFGLLDMLVGLVVALLILWSAVGLLIDLVKSSSGEKIDLSHYGFWMSNVYEHFRDTHLKEWMLYLVDHGEVRTKAELVDRAHQAFDFRNNPWMKMVGLDRQFATVPNSEQILDELI
jgi:Co/Zn/Cd efflux system component